MSEDHRLKTAAAISGLWDGEPIRRVRAGDGVSILPGRRVSLHLMAQTDVAATMLSDHLLADQGLLSRILVTAPEPASGTRLWHDPESASEPAIKRYEARLLSILETPSPLVKGTINELRPRLLPLSAEARHARIAYVNQVERAIGPNCSLEPIRGLANKLPEHAARLGAVLELVENLGAGELSGERMAAGIKLAVHYAAEALRLFQAARVDPILAMAIVLLDWLQNRWKEPLISAPKVYQLGPNPVREAKTAKRLIKILEDHGWLTQVPDVGIVCGVQRREAWQIVKIA